MLRIARQPMFVLLTCNWEATDWHVIRGFDPDQQELAEEVAEDYLKRMPDGTQIAVAKVYTYGIVDNGGNHGRVEGIQSENHQHP